MRRVIGHKVSNQLHPAVMVLAFAGPWSASLNDAVDAASKAGITVVTSAGERLLCHSSGCSHRMSSEVLLHLSGT